MEVGGVLEGDEQSDLPEWVGLVAWNDTELRRNAERVIPKPSKISMYMMLGLLLSSISTLVSHFEPMIGSTMRG